MKKIFPKQYALALYEAVKDAKGEELREKINNFLELVKKQKKLKLLNKIFSNFIAVYQEKEGLMPATVIAARETSHKIKREIGDWLKKYTGRTAILTEEISPEILSGIIIKFEDTILDASLKNQLKKLQNTLEK